MIYPDKENFTANVNSTAILTCNATGIPEPVITWVRTNPEVDFAAHPESRLLSEFRRIIISDVSKWPSVYSTFTFFIYFNILFYIFLVLF